MIRVSYKFGHSLEINTTMNEARGVVSQEIVMGGPDAVQTIHIYLFRRQYVTTQSYTED